MMMTVTPADTAAKRFPGWPVSDRLAWERALDGTAGNFLDDRPAIATWAPRTQQNARNAVSALLRWLRTRAPIRPNDSLGALMSPELLLHYVRHLRQTQVPGTVDYTVFMLAGALPVFAPERDWDWIAPINRRLSALARRHVPTAGPVVHAALLHDLGLRVMQESQNGDGEIDPCVYRDGLIVAMLAVAPMRIANFAALRVGTELRQEGEQWKVYLDADTTKTRRADVWPIGGRVAHFLEHYVGVVRPTLQARAQHPRPTDLLWIGDSGWPIGHQVLRPIIARLTRERLGVQINPHRFRHCAATTFALEQPGDALKNAALLGHASPETTEKHYIVQQRQLVQQDYLKLLHARDPRPSGTA